MCHHLGTFNFTLRLWDLHQSTLWWPPRKMGMAGTIVSSLQVAKPGGKLSHGGWISQPRTLARSLLGPGPDSLSGNQK